MQLERGAEVDRILAAAELWARPVGRPGAAESLGAAESEIAPAVLIAGWEDQHLPCAAGRPGDSADACRACASVPVRVVFATGRPARGACPSGGSLLAFPAPAGGRETVALLRLAPAGQPIPGTDFRPVPARAIRMAARVLRDPVELVRWQAGQRARGVERRRAAVNALEAIVATTEEFHRLYTTADRDRASSELVVSNLNSLARETLRESEEARTQIAHALHDTAAQSMVSAHRFLEAARASLAGPSPASADRHLDAAGERLLMAIREVRAILNSLVPPGLEELGLANALRIYVRDAVPSRVVTEITGDLPRSEGWLEAGLFAMAAEAITNATEHGNPASIGIDLRAQAGRGIITISDDGAGFDPAAARRRTQAGMGLMGMARRAGWLGGRLDVTSGYGAGTTIRITVPLTEPGQPQEFPDAG